MVRLIGFDVRHVQFFVFMYKFKVKVLSNKESTDYLILRSLLGISHKTFNPTCLKNEYFLAYETEFVIFSAAGNYISHEVLKVTSVVYKRHFCSITKYSEYVGIGRHAT